MIFCLGYYFFVLPIPATMIEGKPVTFRFEVPYLTFFNLMLNVTTIVLAFHACRHIYKEGWLTRIWKSMGYFKNPTTNQVWVLAILGFLALLWNVNTQGTELQEAENKGAIGQFLNVFRVYAYVPIVLLFTKYWSDKNKVTFSKRLVWIYILVLSGVAIASTRRMILMNMAVSWAVMYFFTLILENGKLLSPKRIFLIIAGFYLLTGPVADLATAMIVNRATSYDSSASSTFSNVMRLYSDKEALHNAVQMGVFSNTDNGGDNMSGWSEYYLDNIFLDRFCNLRTQDITLDYAQRLGYGSKRMKEYANNFLIFQIPSPILKALGYEQNKFENNYTPGDLLSTDALAYTYQYAGFRVCGDSAVGLSWMGYPYYIFAFFIYILLFYFLSSLVSTRGTQITIPVPVIIGLTVYMAYFNNATGIFKTIALLVRQGWQDILIYCVTMFIIRRFVK